MNNYIPANPDDKITAVLGNISEVINDSSNNGLNGDVIVSLINIEENRISRNPENFVRTASGTFFKNPAVHLYITLFFTSVRQVSSYQPALRDIQNIIGFFQRKFVFDHSNTPLLDNNLEQLVLDMVSLNLQQLHEIWSVLGGRYFPSVVYRMRMVTIDSVTDIPGPVITAVENKYYME